MPTVAEIKNQLKLLKIKGITGKTKAQLFEMLPEGNCLKFVPVKKARAAKPAPEPAPVPIKVPAAKKVVGTAVANPARPALRSIQNKLITETSLPGKKVKAEKLPKYKTGVKSKSETKSKRVDSLAKYIKGYNKMDYQDYEDSRGMEVIYPSSDIVEIITLAYNNTSFNNIVDEAGYNEEETATIIYDHFINKGNKKYKDEDLVMKAMPDPDSD
jgi:hypothetical protein